MDILGQITEKVRQRVEQARREVPLAELAGSVEGTKPGAGFAAALRRTDGIGIIAELKKASPSAGLIRAAFDAATLASQYKAAGAAALSVLTEQDHFQGSLAYLSTAVEATGLPCLRKDFIIDEYQLYQARIHGASAVLLIAAALNDQQLESFHSQANALGMDALCEIHDRAELERVKRAGAKLIGVNSRDLKTLQVRPETHAELAALLPSSVLKVAESGISNGARIAELRAMGYDAFLIGETLMRKPDPGEALLELMKAASVQAKGALQPK